MLGVEGTMSGTRIVGTASATKRREVTISLPLAGWADGERHDGGGYRDLRRRGRLRAGIQRLWRCLRRPGGGKADVHRPMGAGQRPDADCGDTDIGG